MKERKQYKQIDLGNGAKLYYIKNSISKTTVAEVVFYCGARCDTIPGLAHFTEHMFFTGTKKHSKQEITKKYFDFISTNACTTSSSIYFTANVFTNEFADYLNTVAEMVTESVFSQQSVDDECKVISQEIARSKDNFLMHAHMFNDYNLTEKDFCKFSTLGTNESIATIKSKDVKNFVKKYFVKENMDIYVSSPLSLNKVIKIMEKTLMAKIPSNPKFKELPLFRLEYKNEDFLKVHTEQIGKDYIFINFAFANDTNNMLNRKKLELLLELMNNQSDGIMNDLRWGGNKNLTYSGTFYCVHGKEQSMITFNTQCDKQNINPILETVVNYIKRTLKDGFKQEILDFEKREYDYDDAAREPRTYERFNRLKDFKNFGKVYTLSELHEIINETNLNDCTKLFHEIFDNPRVSVSVYGDATNKEVMSKSQFKKLFTQNK